MIDIKTHTKETLLFLYEESLKEKEDYKKALQYFIDRVEQGTIRSNKTYKMYKDLLEKYNGQT